MQLEDTNGSTRADIINAAKQRFTSLQKVHDVVRGNPKCFIIRKINSCEADLKAFPRSKKQTAKLERSDFAFAIASLKI